MRQHEAMAQARAAVSEERTLDMLHMCNNGPSQAFDRVETPFDHVFRDPKQLFALYNVSHVDVAPRAIDGRRPSVRILGLFMSRDSAVLHARNYNSQDESCSLFCAPTAEWRAVPCTYPWHGEADHIAALLRRHADQAARALAEFEAHRRATAPLLRDAADPPVLEPCVLPEPEPELEPELELEPEPELEPELELEPEPEREHRECDLCPFKRDFALPCQQFVALVFVWDDADVPRPAFQVLQAFDTEAEADAYVRNCACHVVKEHDIVIAPMYAWLDLHDRAATARPVHRDSALNKIMAGQRQQQAQLAQYKESGELPRPASSA